MTRTEAPEPAGSHRPLERELEIAALDAAIEPARAGTGALILIEGPAGIGKTTVLRAYGERARDAGFRVLTARGGSLERDLAWAAVRELYAGTADPRHEEVFDGAASLAQAPLGRGSRRQGSSDAIAASLHGLYWLTANLTESGPLLVIVDDAHAVDAASVRFLTYLSARIADLPAVVALALRADDPLATDEPVLSLRALPEAQVVVPRPLSEKASVDFLTATFAK